MCRKGVGKSGGEWGITSTLNRKWSGEEREGLRIKK
jgi:hypothetical protein